MAAYGGQIDVYFANVLSPKFYGGRRIMNLGGSFGKAILWFMPQGSSLPDNQKRPNQNVFDVYYHKDDWEAIIDILRNEKPVYFHFYDGGNAAQIYTGTEPVGEGEP
jgi:hypothetical protein